jgi:hypothetical protein
MRSATPGSPPQWVPASHSAPVALTWLGRGDGGVEDWSELRAEAARAHNRHTAGYLLGIPLLADYLEEAASLFGIECEGET